MELRNILERLEANDNVVTTCSHIYKYASALLTNRRSKCTELKSRIDGDMSRISNMVILDVWHKMQSITEKAWEEHAHFTDEYRCVLWEKLQPLVEKLEALHPTNVSDHSLHG